MMMMMMVTTMRNDHLFRWLSDRRNQQEAAEDTCYSRLIRLSKHAIDELKIGIYLSREAVKKLAGSLKELIGSSRSFIESLNGIRGSRSLSEAILIRLTCSLILKRAFITSSH